MRETMVALAAAMAVVCGQAEAAVFTFTPTSIGPTSSPFLTLDAAVFTISISDAAVRSGSFTYDYRYRYEPTVNPPQGSFIPSAKGDVQALQSFSTRFGGVSFGSGQGPGGTSSDYFSTSLKFSTAGEITSGFLTYSDDRFFNDLTGTSGLFTGNFAIGNTFPTSITGRFAGALPTATEVPEPAMPGLLAMAVASCVIVREWSSRRSRHVERRVVAA